jgi:hypothetical protein
MDAFRVQSFTPGHLKQRINDITANLRSTRVAGNPEVVSAASDFNVEAAFDLSQMLIELTAKIGQTVVVGGFQDDFPGYLYGVQGWAVSPLSVNSKTQFDLKTVSSRLH